MKLITIGVFQVKMNKIAVATGFALALCAGAANAGGLASGAGKIITVDGGTVHFQGKLVAAPCAVSDDTSDQTVKLGQYTTHHFAKKGSVGMVKPFEIKLEDCDTSVASTAAVAFSGITDATDPTLLAINQDDTTTGTVTATGVAIKILDNASNIVKLDGTTFTDKTTILDGDNTPALKFTAQYVALSDNGATGGDANGDVNFIMQYQ